MVAGRGGSDPMLKNSLGQGKKTIGHATQLERSCVLEILQLEIDFGAGQVTESARVLHRSFPYQRCNTFGSLGDRFKEVHGSIESRLISPH